MRCHHSVANHSKLRVFVCPIVFVHQCKSAAAHPCQAVEWQGCKYVLYRAVCRDACRQGWWHRLLRSCRCCFFWLSLCARIHAAGGNWVSLLPAQSGTKPRLHGAVQQHSQAAAVVVFAVRLCRRTWLLFLVCCLPHQRSALMARWVACW